MILREQNQCSRTNNKTDSVCMYKRNGEALSNNSYWCGRARIITYSECLSVALIIKHAKLMFRIILSFVSCLALPYSSAISQKHHVFRKNVLNIKYVFVYV
jgi:hypothetical protein